MNLLDLMGEALNGGKNDLEIKIKEFQNQISNKLKELEEMKQYTVDRFEGEIAVLEDRKTGEMINVSKSELPSSIYEGSILKKENDKFLVDEELQKEVQKRIEEKAKELFN